MPGSPTILHINVARGYRGGERQTELLIRELDQRGFNQVLVNRRGAPLGERLSDLNIDRRPSSGNPLSSFNQCRDADIIHVHEGRSAHAAHLNSVIRGTPYLITRRVDNPISNNIVAHLAYRRAHFVVAIAPAVADVLTSFDEQINIRQISSCSSLFKVCAAMSQSIRSAHDGQFIVGHVGALDNHQKGQEYILDAASSLRESHPQIHFMIVGGGEDEHRLRAAAEQRGLSNVTFTGFIDNVGDYLAAFDIFLMPSNFEALGSILIDAMNQGLPVVATQVGGIPTLVHHDETGILVEPRRSDQIRNAILQLYGDKQLRKRMGKAAREQAMTYTPAAMCDSYVSIYEDILAS